MTKEVGKTSRDENYYEKFRLSATETKKSMDLVESFRVHKVSVYSYVYVVIDFNMKLKGGLPQFERDFQVSHYEEGRLRLRSNDSLRSSR